jgi:hypothetical protein
MGAKPDIMAKSKNNHNRKRMFPDKKVIALGVAVLLLAILFLSGILNPKLPPPDLGKGEDAGVFSLESFYSEDRCRCFERERIACTLGGFEYNSARELCVNSAEMKVTSPSKACSKYECSGFVYSSDADKNSWRKE